MDVDQPAEAKPEEGDAAAKSDSASSADKKDDDSSQPESKVVKKEELSDSEKERQEKIEKLSQILSGHKTIYLHLQFLMRNDHSDMLILKQTYKAAALRVSICHTATVIANGFMHCGTTHDSFLRENLDWLSIATNWARLSGNFFFIIIININT